MNKERRTKIGNVITALNTLRDQVQDIHDDEDTALGNLPESLEGSDRYDMMQEAVDNLDEALSSLEDAIDFLDSARE